MSETRDSNPLYSDDRENPGAGDLGAEGVGDLGEGVDGAQGTIDPELIPYLEAAAEAAEDSPQAARDRELAELSEREQQDSEALRLLASGGLLGDVQVLDGHAELFGEDDGASDADHASDEAWDEGLRHLEELRGVAASNDLDARVAAVYEQIVARAPEHDIDPTLDRVREVLDLMGNPQDAAPVIHLTGTNGKTSTARMIEALLRAHGLRTGRFTSPHLHTARERIAIDGEPISREGFLDAWEQAAPFIEMVDERFTAAGGGRLSFFEVFTVMAFVAFADAPVDVVVLEVGMGGRWDATNVADAQVAVLAPIARDHERWLGRELTQIAAEKGGVIKERATVVSAVQEPEVAELIAQAAARQRALLVAETPALEYDGEDFGSQGAPGAQHVAQRSGVVGGASASVLDRSLIVGGQLVTLRTPAAVYEDVVVPLHGKHQAHNALLAVCAVEAFFGGSALDGRVLEEGMTAVTSPGRLEVVRSSPLVILDAGHNPAGVAATREAMVEVFGLRQVVGVFGAMADKDVEGVLAELEPLLDEVVLSPISTPRAMDVEDLAAIAEDVFGEERVHRADDVAGAIDQAVSLAEADGGAPMTHEAPSGQMIASSGVLVLGSVMLVAEARQVLGRGANA